jgi:hypothetical protein
MTHQDGNNVQTAQQQEITDSPKRPKKWTTETWIQFFGIIATISAAFFGAWLGTTGSESLWQKQTDIQQKNVAKALKIEILSMKDKIDYSAKQFHPDLIPYRFTPTPMNFHYYTENGLYYSFQSEIASFNPNLSTSLFIYYNDLITAEELRVIVNEKSEIIAKHPEYTPKGTINTIAEIQEMENSPFIKTFNIDDYSTKRLIWEGYDPKNLSRDENVIIAQSRSANQELKEKIINASEMQPIILAELEKEIQEKH